jgi:hypothetical protein
MNPNGMRRPFWPHKFFIQIAGQATQFGFNQDNLTEALIQKVIKKSF